MVHKNGGLNTAFDSPFVLVVSARWVCRGQRGADFEPTGGRCRWGGKPQFRSSTPFQGAKDLGHLFQSESMFCGPFHECHSNHFMNVWVPVYLCILFTFSELTVILQRKCFFYADDTFLAVCGYNRICFFLQFSEFDLKVRNFMSKLIKGV